MSRPMVLTAREAARIGIRPKRKPFDGLRLPSLEGVGLERITEQDLQRQVLGHLRVALPPGSRAIAIPNQRAIRHLPPAAQHKVLASLIADGMAEGASDLLVVWDATLGEPGNRGMAWIELKRPVKPAPVSANQIAFAQSMRALGIVAGWAQSLEQVEHLLVEAGAPLRIRLLGKAGRAEAAWGGTPQTKGPSAGASANGPDKKDNRDGC